MKKIFGFTLAEVLITLGIIGVVAALTIPSVIGNYKKEVTAKKLEHTYSVLSQALRAAQAEHGDPANWDLGGFYYGMPADGSKETILNNFASNYLLPYLKVIKDYGFVTTSQASTKVGYDGPYKPISNDFAGLNEGYYFVLADGTLVNLFLGSNCSGYDSDGKCNAYSYAYITFGVDINGSKGNNQLGKEYFLMYYNQATHKFLMYSAGNNASRDFMRSSCNTDDALSCGGLIQYDGWKIKDDYPWF